MLATVVFLDSEGLTRSVKFRNITSANALAVFSGVLGNYSDACDWKRTVLDSVVDAAPTYGEGAFHSVKQKATIVYRNLDATPDETAVFRFELPAPKESIFEDIPKQGKKVTAIAGNAIIGAMATATGLNLEFIEGFAPEK